MVNGMGLNIWVLRGVMLGYNCPGFDPVQEIASILWGWFGM